MKPLDVSNRASAPGHQHDLSINDDDLDPSTDFWLPPWLDRRNPSLDSTAPVGGALLVGSEAAGAAATGALVTSMGTNQALNASAVALGVPTAITNYASAVPGGTLDGAGLTIGILSDSFNELGGESMDITDGLLPSGVTILQEDPYAGGTDEGRAMAQLIHQIAPDAQIDFYSAEGSEASFATGVTALQMAGCNVIVDDVTYTDEPFYQTAGTIDAAIQAAVNAGVDYFTSANNNGNNYYEAAFVPLTGVAAPPGIPAGDLVHNVGGNSPYEQIYLFGADPNLDITVEWDQSFTNSRYTLGVALYSLTNGTYTQLYDFATNVPGGTSDPGPSTGGAPVLSIDETLSQVTAAGAYYLVFYESSSERSGGQVITPGEFKVIAFQDTDGTIDGTGAGAGSGSSIGHELLTDVNTVGAVNVENTPSQGVSTPVVENYSADGPGETYVSSAGSIEASPISDGKPNFAATDGSDVEVHTSSGSISSEFNPFYGTSAAAPNAAAVSLLMLQADPRLTPVQVTYLLTRSAIPTNDATTGGAGLIQAPSAVGGSTTADLTPIWTEQGTTTSWNTAANWSDDTIPGSTSPVQIADGLGLFTGSYSVVDNEASDSVASLVVDGGTITGAIPDLQVQATKTLEAGGITLGAGTIDVSGTLADSGSLLAGSAAGALTVETAARVSVAGGAAGSAIAYSGVGGQVVFATTSAATLTGGLRDPIGDFAAGDLLDLSGLPVSSVAAVHVSGSAVTVVNAADQTLAALTLTGAFSGLAFAPDAGGGTELVACYAAGTRILTNRGERAIETLTAGDMVVSALRQHAVPVCWIGHRHVDLQRPGSAAARPVVVVAGAFGPGLPHRDLVLSPDHAVFVDGALVPIRCLVNHATIRRRETGSSVTYYHVELAEHDVLLADGLPAESWLDTGNGSMFANGPPPPRALRAGPSKPCAALVEDGARLKAIRARLAARAAEMGAAVPDELSLDLARGECRGVLRAGVGFIRLASGSCMVGADCRRLGAMVRRCAVDGVALSLSAEDWSGFHAVERHGGGAVRWTDGDAVIPVVAAPVDRRVVVDVVAMASPDPALAA